MRTVPRTNHERIAFYETHINVWEEHGEALGLSTERLIELREAIETAREEFEAADAARQAAQAATLRAQTALRTLHSAPGMGQDTIDTIRLTAATTGDHGVYALARIDPPQADAPIAAPNKPSHVESRLLPIGEVELRWTGKQPSGSQGTVYQIERAVDDDARQGRFTFAGVSGERKFVDASLPAGPRQVVYRITAIRGKQRSQPAVHTMQFGVVREALATARLAA